MNVPETEPGLEAYGPWTEPLPSDLTFYGHYAGFHLPGILQPAELGRTNIENYNQIAPKHLQISDEAGERIIGLRQQRREALRNAGNAVIQIVVDELALRLRMYPPAIMLAGAKAVREALQTDDDLDVFVLPTWSDPQKRALSLPAGGDSYIITESKSRGLEVTVSGGGKDLDPDTDRDSINATRLQHEANVTLASYSGDDADELLKSAVDYWHAEAKDA